MDSENHSFGTLLRRYRVEAGLTQEELAERARLSATGLSALERGVRSRPHRATIDLLTDALALGLADRASLTAAARALVGQVISPDAEPPVGSVLGAVPRTPLVGREQELGRIRSMLSSTAEGHGQMLLLGGEIGAGKTRLLQEIAVEAGRRGYLLVTGRCHETKRQTPYSLFFQVLAALRGILPTGLRSDGEHVWKLMRSTSSGSIQAVDEHQLSEAVTRLLLVASRSVPIALLLDDLHWIDGMSLQLLQHIARATQSSPIMVACSFCDVATGEAYPEFARALQILGHERLLERIAVRRLSLEETADFVSEVTGSANVSEEFSSFVYRRTKGNPRLLDGLLRSLGGRLQLQEEIGAGSMGRVFRAFDTSTESVVAAKLVLARAGIDFDALQRFQQEGAILRSLHHPNIVRIYDSFADEHVGCIVMELLEGQPLSRVLDDGALPLPRAKHLALQVARALSHAHSQSIVHRDIKPDNVMVLAGDRLKVTDFGIARLRTVDPLMGTVATTGMRTGTPLYMAPEQIQDNRIDGRTDVYGFGAMVYHMVTGRPPFDGSDALAIAVQHVQEQPAPPCSLRPELPLDWQALILKSLAKDPTKRFQSMKEVEKAIAGLPDAETEKLPASRRAPWAVAAGTALLLITLMMGAWAYTATQARPESLSAKVGAYLSALAGRGRLTGTVLVARKGRVLIDRGYGLADRRNHIPNRADTRFGLSTAATTSLLVADIVQEIGVQSAAWTDPICRYLSPCPGTWTPITLKLSWRGSPDSPTFDGEGRDATRNNPSRPARRWPWSGVPRG